MNDTPPGIVIWITGLSCTGKSTAARALQERLRSRDSLGAILLDGDELREALGNFNYEPSARRQLGFFYARLARSLSLQGFDVIVATISLVHEIHSWCRANIPNYLEVLLTAADDELARRGSLRSATGSGATGPKPVVQLPLAPHLVVDSSEGLAPDEIAGRIAGLAAGLRGTPKPGACGSLAS